MKERKWTPHIIAAAVLVVFIVLGLACASAPKAPEEIVFDSSIPEDQMATLFITPGIIEVTHFDGSPLNPRWFQTSNRDRGMDVKIPAGRHSINFNFNGGETYGGTARGNVINFDVAAGRNYTLFFALLRSSGRSTTVQFEVLESSQKRIPKADEQLVFIKLDGLSVNILLDKDTDNERKFRLLQHGEIYFIVSKGEEHTIDVELTPAYIYDFGNDLTSAPESQRNFTASSEPIRYSLKLQGRGLGTNTKTTYTLTRR